MKNDNFDEWFDEQEYADYDGCYQEKYLAAKDAWDEQEARIKQVIVRLESYPTCASCYLTLDESIVASSLKERVVEILKKELLYMGSG